MKYNFRPKFRHRGFELGVIADIAANVFNDGPHGCQVEEVRFGAGGEGVPPNLRAPFTKPEGEPTALEASVTG
jgi:hypothetical protein